MPAKRFAFRVPCISPSGPSLLHGYFSALAASLLQWPREIDARDIREFEGVITTSAISSSIFSGERVPCALLRSGRVNPEEMFHQFPASAASAMLRFFGE